MGVGAIAGTTAVVGTTASLEVVGGAVVGATAAAQAARSSLAGAGGATAGGTSAAAGAGAVSSTDRTLGSAVSSTLGSAVSSTLGSAVSSTRRRGADSLGCYVRAVSVEIWALLHSSLGSVKHVNPPMPQKPQGAGNPYRNRGYGARPTRAPGREEARAETPETDRSRTDPTRGHRPPRSGPPPGGVRALQLATCQPAPRCAALRRGRNKTGTGLALPLLDLICESGSPHHISTPHTASCIMNYQLSSLFSFSLLFGTRCSLMPADLAH